MKIRWKLFFSLFVLTAAAVAAVLWQAEKAFGDSTRKAVGQRFEAQIEGLLDARSERLERVRSMCATLAGDEMLRAELRGEERSEARRRDFVARYEALRSSEEPRNRSRRGQPLMGLLNRDGDLHFIAGGARDPAERQRRATRIEALAESASQEVAYVVVDGDPREVVVTAVEEEPGDLLGWFFLGLDAETRGEQLFQRAEKLTRGEARTGIVIESEWFMPDLSDEERAELEAAAIELSPEESEPHRIELAGKTYLLASAPLNPGSPLGRGHQVTLFPIGNLIAEVTALRWRVGFIGVLAAVAAGAVAWFLAARFSRPIAELVGGTERVRRGDFGEDVPVRSKDELGHLAEAFNRMTRDLELKERYHEVLGKVSDPAVARRLMEGELELGGEVLEASVLFCDIRGFTAMTDGMPPAEVIELLNEHMTALTRVVYQHGGVVDKFVGDLVMAIFGAPQSQGDDALSAARCAVAMIAERRALDARTGRRVEIGIGVAHGPLVAGCMGSADRLNYTVLGDRVNLAARLCSAAGPGEVVVDEAIATAARAEFTVRSHEPVSLKGFGAPVAIFSLAAGASS